MKKRILCKTIDSILPNDDIASQDSICLPIFSGSFFILDNNEDAIPGAVIYTRKIKITKIRTGNYLTEESLDFYA